VEKQTEVPSGEPSTECSILPRSRLDSLIQALRTSGYRVIGPVVRDGVILFDDLESDKDLPVGYRDEQSGGRYRLTDVADDFVFGFVVGPHSLKRYLFVPKRQLASVDRDETGISFSEQLDEPEPIAVIGARPCDIAAMQVQDKVFLGDFPDPDYGRRRENLFVVAVNCSHPASTCFCASMGTGPRVDAGFDLALTELHDDGRHDFLVEANTEAGSAILSQLETNQATEDDRNAALEVTRMAEAAMSKTMDTDGIRDLLLSNLDDPEWEDVAERCLTCANCTMACPTCFCSLVEDVTDLEGVHAERWQVWDSCFTVDHSYIHGGSVRKSARSRYRQWMTHKLASWIDQFGVSGCVGCGRCITWCPVGIDITEEVARIREHSKTDG
jgi:hypothetical protein